MKFKSCNIFSNSTVIVNGKVVTKNGSGNGTEKRIDEKRVERNSEINSIFVNSTIADVQFYISESEEYTVHCHGKAILDNEIELDVKVENNQLKVLLEYNGSCINGNIKLDISIPKKEYQRIFITANSADILLPKNIVSNSVTIKSTSGDINSEADGKEFNIQTMSGDVYININASKDIHLNVSTMSGDVKIYLDNIGLDDINTSTMSGYISKGYITNGRYSIQGNISTMSGDIIIK